MPEFRKLLICCFLFFPLLLCAQEIEKKEHENSIFIIGLGGVLELEESLYGVNGRFYYGINETFCFGPEISYFPYQSTEYDSEKSIIDLNINAHYIFEFHHKLGLYPLLGFNYTIDKIRLTDNPEESESESEVGINYGFGAHYNLSHYFIFSEFKGVVGPLSAEFVTTGVIYEF